MNSMRLMIGATIEEKVDGSGLGKGIKKWRKNESNLRYLRIGFPDNQFELV